MQVSYNNLFKKLIDKGLKKTEFAKEAGISPGTLAKLSKNETISMENLLKIYKFLGCNSFDEIIEVIDWFFFFELRLISVWNHDLSFDSVQGKA